MFDFLRNIFAAMNQTFGSATAESDDLQAIGPTVNVDGTPMVGAFDINGNPYGITDQVSSAFEPVVNIDGTPMVGPDDIKGNPYGVASDSCNPHDSWDSGSSLGSNDCWSGGDSSDSWSIGGGFGNDD